MMKKEMVMLRELADHWRRVVRALTLQAEAVVESVSLRGVSSSLRRHWPLVAGGIMITGLVLAGHRDNRRHDELLALRDEVRILRQMIDERLPGQMLIPRAKRWDGRIMVAELA
jgi:hypothetical protein